MECAEAPAKEAPAQSGLILVTFVASRALFELEEAEVDLSPYLLPWKTLFVPVATKTITRPLSLQAMRAAAIATVREHSQLANHLARSLDTGADGGAERVERILAVGVEIVTWAPLLGGLADLDALKEETPGRLDITMVGFASYPSPSPPLPADMAMPPPPED